MVALVPSTRLPVPAPAVKSSKPLLRRSTLSGTVRKFDDAELELDTMSAPSSPHKRARVTFNPTVEEKIMEVYQVKARSMDSIRGEVKRSIEAHIRDKCDSEGYDKIREIFEGRRGDEEEEEEEEGFNVDIRTYLLALTTYTSLLDNRCGSLVASLLACEWMGRDQAFVTAYIKFLVSLVSAKGMYVGMVLGMLAGHFRGSKTSMTSTENEHFLT